MSLPPDPPVARRAVLILADGTVLHGHGAGAAAACDGELCFTTGMTGYQETMTDPSFAAQIVTFTQPELGVVGCNEEDLETEAPVATGLVARHLSPVPSNFRATESLDDWLSRHKVPAIHGVDTRTLVRHLRDSGAQMARLISLAAGETLDEASVRKHAAEVAALPGMAGRELAAEVSRSGPSPWRQTRWTLGAGYGTQTTPQRHVVALDYGAKLTILRCLAEVGCRVTVMPATSTAEEILAQKPDGLFLSNGPGDPAATATYAVPVLRRLLEHQDLPVFGICIGHQLLAEALGAETRKMARGHRGANQPVQDLSTGKVHVTSQNHGFEVVTDSLPSGVVATEVSLFDGSNEGLAVTGRPVFSVQYHPEASPGPHDTLAHFRRFADMVDRARANRG